MILFTPTLLRNKGNVVRDETFGPDPLLISPRSVSFFYAKIKPDTDVPPFVNDSEGNGIITLYDTNNRKIVKATERLQVIVNQNADLSLQIHSYSSITQFEIIYYGPSQILVKIPPGDTNYQNAKLVTGSYGYHNYVWHQFRHSGWEDASIMAMNQAAVAPGTVASGGCYVYEATFSV
jgi:hypothetical protein